MSFAPCVELSGVPYLNGYPGIPYSGYPTVRCLYSFPNGPVEGANRPLVPLGSHIPEVSPVGCSAHEELGKGLILIIRSVGESLGSSL